MEQLLFEWDARKNEINKRKHGVSFEEARTCFFDEEGSVISDPDHSLEEDRYILMGKSARSNILIVCHTYRGDIIRIISARKATGRETIHYKRRHLS